MENSHYTLTWDSIPTDPGYLLRHAANLQQAVPDHGEIAIDPASATILRLMLLADMKPEEFTAKSGTELEYAQVSMRCKASLGSESSRR